MGKKVHPYSLRLGITKTWRSRWYAKGNDYVENLQQDIKVKKLVNSHLNDAGVSSVEIDRTDDNLAITIKTSRPGVVIGRQGASLEELKKKVQTLIQSRNVDMKVEEIRKPEIDASVIAQSIAKQISKRFPYRRACKQAIEKAMEMNIKGCKIRVSGRLNGAEIARSEVFIQGRIPLHTLRADIDYASEASFTTYGKIGVKVWIYKDDQFIDKRRLRNKKKEELKEATVNETQEEVKASKNDDNIIDIPSEV